MNTKLEELNLDEAFLEPEGFVNRAMFRDAEFSVKRIGGTPEDPKFTHHTLNFKGPNWFGWIRVVVIGKAWREQAARWFTINVFARRLDGPMFMSQNERNETAVDLGKDFHYGKIKELPAPESLYPYLEAALDENQEMFQGFEVEGDEDIDKVVYTISLSIIHLLKGAHILNEAIDPDEFMSPVINQGGFKPMRWRVFNGYVARGDEKWDQRRYILPVGSFDDKIYGGITFVMDVGSPDDIRKADGLCKFSARFELSTVSPKQHRHDTAAGKVRRRNYERRGGEEPWPYIMPNHEAWLEVSYRAKPEWIPDIKKAYELLVSKYWRPLLDQRDDQGNPMLKQNEEALRQEFMQVFTHKSEFGESINLTPDEFEEFGEVASDIQYVSAWRHANGGISNRFTDLHACDLACPTEHPFTGYLTVYKSSESPFILQVGIWDGYTRGKYIIGYFKAPPSDRILDKVRAAALQQIKAYLSGEDIQGNASAIANQFAAAIQSHISGDPEVLSLNYTERTNESVDTEDFVDDFITRDGLQEWKPQNLVPHEDMAVVVNTGMGFKFDNLHGVVSFLDYWQHDKRVNMVHVGIIDSYSAEDWTRYYGTGDSNSKLHINVPENQVPQLQAALEQFIGRDVREINRQAVAAGSTLLPNQSRRLSLALRRALRPWLRVLESIDPEAFWGDVEAHGGQYLEWYQDMRYERKTYRLDIKWIDQSHRAVMVCGYTPELGERTWSVGLAIEVKDEDADGVYYKEVCKFNSLTMLTPKTMPQFQARTIEFAKWLVKTFGSHNWLVDEYSANQAGVTRKQQVNEIKKQFDMATNWTGLKEMLAPEEFLSDFDAQGVMRPWKTSDYRETATTHPHIHHRVIIEHPDRTSPFNDKVELNVDYFLSHETVTGMPTEPFVIITGSYAHRGWPAQEMKAITVKFKTDKEVLPVVDQIARRYLLPKIKKNGGTSGSFAYFWRKLAARMAENGWLVESKIIGHGGDKLRGGAKYWLDRDGRFIIVDDHEDIKDEFPPGWEANYNMNVDIDAAWREAIKLGFVRVTTWDEIVFNPPATDLQMRALLQAAMEKGWPLIADRAGKPPITIWQPVQEALDLTFRSECVGAYGGQTNMVLYAELDGQAVGRIEYSVYNGEVYVQFIKTQPGHRRQGIATALAKQLQSEYPDTEIEWSASTEDGTQFIASLNREFEPDPNYDLLKKAYDDAKAERDGLQKEFDAWTAAGKGKLPPEMLMKGERMNEIETFLWDLEDKMRDLKPGRWMIRESVDPESFYTGYEDEAAIEGWYGADMNVSTGGGAYLHVNKSQVFGPVIFNLYMRPYNRTYADPEFDASFQISSWAQASGEAYQGLAECPDLWVRLSPTKGRPSFQPGNIEAFMADVKQACHDFARRGCHGRAAVDLHQTATAMFILLYNRLKKKGWKMDVDKHGGVWNLDDNRFQEALEFGSEDMEDIARKATSAWGQWEEVPFETPHGDTGTDWIFKVQAPEGKFYKDNNWIRLRFYDKEPERAVVRGSMAAHFVSVNPYYARVTAYTPEYLHVDFDKQFIVKPGEEEDFRKAVAAEFQRTIGQAVLNTPANQFSLPKLDQKLKMGYTRLIRRFWPEGAVWV